ncbi:hypothetical protein ASPCAL12052 [Aspergillus calidoustus]|uniref:Protection of telomeres protein 1 n=1 Tax=Aspergillus calidoustus TaxID=454130 RepID=A0A0U5GB31_ASPCI|nr:hypothetical protein ASPCAL12052 [Aspergillus calidoustus]
MPAGLPPKYVDVASALRLRRAAANVMGIVVDVWGDPYKSSGTSFCVTFTIKDSNLTNGHSWDGLKIKYFKETESLLPPVTTGDVILLREIWVKVMHSQPMGVAAQDINIPWAIFRPDQDPTAHIAPITGPVPFEPTYAEKSYASSLFAISPGTFRIAPAPKPDFARLANAASRSTSTTQRRFALIKDIDDRQFVDLIGEILKIHSSDSEKATLYFTDYTENEKMFYYASDNDPNLDQGREGDEYNYIGRQKKKWDGPSGRMIIQITLWEPHASFVRDNFELGGIVRLKNVRIKGSRVEGGSLEGVIHTDRDNPRAVNAFRVDMKDDPRVQEFLTRKAEYLEAHPKPQKRKAEEDLRSASKKANTKKQRVKPPPKREEGQISLPLASKAEVLPHVKAGADCNARQISLYDILNNKSHNHKSPEGIEYRLPFQNFIYFSTVRVVDHYPHRLEDFAVPQEQRSLGYDEERDPAGARTIKKWEWRFCLLVEDVSPPAPGQPKARTKLFVSDTDAVYLLQLDAADLRSHPTRLHDLRETLFTLWGNLHEIKTEALEGGSKFPDLSFLDSKPFNCCIREYGIVCSHKRDSKPLRVYEDSRACANGDCFGWERRLGLVKTTIH